MKRVLVAEDNAVNRELLHELLETYGYEVVQAADGLEALRMAEQSNPDIVLLDIGMPELDGFGVIQRLRANPSSTALPVLAVTAYTMQGDRARILAAGFDGYLAKPINPQALMKEMERLLQETPAARIAEAAT